MNDINKPETLTAYSDLEIRIETKIIREKAKEIISKEKLKVGDFCVIYNFFISTLNFGRVVNLDYENDYLHILVLPYNPDLLVKLSKINGDEPELSKKRVEEVYKTYNNFYSKDYDFEGAIESIKINKKGYENSHKKYEDSFYRSSRISFSKIHFIKKIEFI